MTDKRNDTHDIFELKKCVETALVKCNTRLNIIKPSGFDMDAFLEIAFGIQQYASRKKPVTRKEQILKAKMVWYPLLGKIKKTNPEAEDLLKRWSKL